MERAATAPVRRCVTGWNKTRPAEDLKKLADGLTSGLSAAREKEVLDFLSQGFLYKEIAEKLGISYETVHTYVRRIYEKLQVRTRTEAVAKFLRR